MNNRSIDKISSEEVETPPPSGRIFSDHRRMNSLSDENLDDPVVRRVSGDIRHKKGTYTQNYVLHYAFKLGQVGFLWKLPLKVLIFREE